MVQDPRAKLGSSGAPRDTGANVEPQYFEFAALEPTVATPGGSRQWWVRSQALVLAYVELAAGDRFSVERHEDEFVLLIPGSSSVSVGVGADAQAVAGEALVVVPPGDGWVEAPDGAVLIAVFSSQSSELAGRCVNADFYAEPDPNVAAWRPWPAGTGGDELRVYDVGAIEPSDGRFGRIYRCSTVMVNWFYEDPGPRDPRQMSPHHHDDFEQISLQLAGDYVHHIRTPWTADMTTWRDDDHHHTTSPAMTIIPPPSIHTSQAVGETAHQLIDIFGPPRIDFSSSPGWVLNEADYPAMPS